MPALWSAGVGLVFLVVYLTIAPGVSGDQDASELTLTLAAGGIPHPSGYPIYAWLGHWFCVALAALGASWPYAANAWSALGGAVAVGLFHALVARVPGPSAQLGRWPRMILACVVTGLAGLNPAWTAVAAVAEVHSWHLAWVSMTLLLYLVTMRGLLESWSNRRNTLHVTAWGIALGLGVAHHLSGILIAAPLTVVLLMSLTRAGRWRLAHAPLLLAGLLLPLASYGYVFWRATHPAWFQWPMLEPSPESVVRHILGGGYTRYFGRFAPGDLQQTLLALNVFPFLFAGLVVLAVAAWTAASRSERLIRIGFVVAAAVQTAWAFTYGVPDPAAYFLPALWTAMLALPISIAAARRSMRYMLLVAGAGGLAAAAAPWLKVATERRDGFVYVDNHLRTLWRGIPFERAIVIWPRDTYCRFIEYQQFGLEKRQIYVTQPNLLTYPGPRRDFERRFGFDPMAGVQVRSEAELNQALPEAINQRIPLPVVVVDPLGFAATTLPKPLRETAAEPEAVAADSMAVQPDSTAAPTDSTGANPPR